MGLRCLGPLARKSAEQVRTGGCIARRDALSAPDLRLLTYVKWPGRPPPTTVYLKAYLAALHARPDKPLKDRDVTAAAEPSAPASTEPGGSSEVPAAPRKVPVDLVMSLTSLLAGGTLEITAGDLILGSNNCPQDPKDKAGELTQAKRRRSVPVATTARRAETRSKRPACIVLDWGPAETIDLTAVETSTSSATAAISGPEKDVAPAPASAFLVPLKAAESGTSLPSSTTTNATLPTYGCSCEQLLATRGGDYNSATNL